MRSVKPSSEAGRLKSRPYKTARANGLKRRSPILLVAPDRFAFLEERPHSFTRILTGADLIAEFVQVLVLGFEGIADDPRDHLLHRAHRQGGVACNGLRPF